MTELTIYASRRDAGDGAPSRFSFAPPFPGGTPAAAPRQWRVTVPMRWALSTDHPADAPMLLVGWVAGSERRLSAARVLELAQRHRLDFRFVALRG